MTTPRVLILTTFYHPLLGGVETHAREFADFLHRRGASVAVVTKRVDGLPAREEIDGIAVHRIPPRGPRTAGAKWLVIPFAVAALLRLRARYDVIYCPDPRAMALAAVPVAWLLGRGVVLEAATPGAVSCANWDPALRRWHIDPGGWLGRALKWVPRHIYAAAHGIACLSAQIAEETRTAGAPTRAVLHVPHGIDLARFRPARPDEARELRGRLGLPPDDLLCLFVGRLSREKGVMEILQAWHHLQPRRAQLLLVGPDTPGHPLDVGREARDFVTKHRLDDRVMFYGPVPDPSEVLRAADVFIHPSHYEAFGLAVAEAIASGLPVVATDVEGLREYLVHESNALLCPPNAPEALAAQLERLLGDAELRARLGRAGRATAERQLDREVALSALLEFIRRATAAKIGVRG